MQFTIDKQPYFLDFIPEENGWFVFKPTRNGVEIVPVVHDDAPLDPEAVAVGLDTGSVN